MWPSQNIDYQDTNLESANLELKKSAKAITCSIITLPNNEVNMHELIDINRYSLLQRMSVVTSYMPRFIHNTRNAVRLRGIITLEEISKSKQLWIKSEQTVMNKDAKFSKVKQSLRVFRDKQGFYRVGGRFGNYK